jgi:hypothetical protein
VNYILGVAGQNAANARRSPAARWTGQLPRHRRRAVGATRPRQIPIRAQTRTQLREHDDREQFPAGIDVTLTGIETLNRGKDSPFGSSQGFTGSRPGLPSERDPPPAQ